MRMTSTQPPEPEFTLETLAPLLALVYALLEAGVEEARQWFTAREKPVNNVVFAAMVRLRLAEDLLDATAKAGIPCRVIHRPNIGIRILYGMSQIAVWKADKDGLLPAVGDSLQRQSFYHQPTLLHTDDGSPTVPRKLALLWERCSVSGLLTVKLAAPRGYNSFWKSGDAHWMITVPHPAKQIAPTTDFAEQTEDWDQILRQKKKANERVH
jgi:hypothetical protein